MWCCFWRFHSFYTSYLIKKNSHPATQQLLSTYSNDPSVKNGLFFHPLRGFLKDKARVLLIIWRPKMKPFYDFLFSTKICLFLNKFNLEWEKFLHLVYIVYCIMNSFVVKCHTVYLCTALNGYQNARPLLYTCQTMKLWFLLKNKYSTEPIISKLWHKYPSKMAPTLKFQSYTR